MQPIPDAGAEFTEEAKSGQPTPPVPGAPAKPAPHNPFYLLLLVAGVMFVVTALAYAIIPVLEQKAIDAGEIPPPSPFRDALRADGWRWLLWEVVAIVLLSLASMMLDRLRTLKNGRASGTIPSDTPNKHP